MSTDSVVYQQALRTLAAVPPNQAIVVRAPESMFDAVASLGFSVFSDDVLQNDSHELHWGLVILDGATWADVVRHAKRMVPHICDGGWIFVGLVAAVEFEADPRRAMQSLLDTEPLAVAQSISTSDESGRRDLWAIVRKVSEHTVP